MSLVYKCCKGPAPECLQELTPWYVPAGPLRPDHILQFAKSDLTTVGNSASMLCVARYYMFSARFFFFFSSDGCFVSLTQNTVQFAKSSLQLVDDLLRLYTIELETLIGVAVETVFNAQMMQFQAALKAEKFQADVSWICCIFWCFFVCCCLLFFGVGLFCFSLVLLKALLLLFCIALI